MNNLVRLNVLFICGSAILLVLEITSPYFGWWHGFYLACSLGFSFIGSGMLHRYSSRMIENLTVRKGGTHIDVKFMNAFFTAKSETLRIQDIGYCEPSRLYNVHYATYQ